MKTIRNFTLLGMLLFVFVAGSGFIWHKMSAQIHQEDWNVSPMVPYASSGFGDIVAKRNVLVFSDGVHRYSAKIEAGKLIGYSSVFGETTFESEEDDFYALFGYVGNYLLLALRTNDADTEEHISFVDIRTGRIAYDVPIPNGASVYYPSLSIYPEYGCITAITNVYDSNRNELNEGYIVYIKIPSLPMGDELEYQLIHTDVSLLRFSPVPIQNASFYLVSISSDYRFIFAEANQGTILRITDPMDEFASGIRSIFKGDLDLFVVTNRSIGRYSEVNGDRVWLLNYGADAQTRLFVPLSRFISLSDSMRDLLMVSIYNDTDVEVDASGQSGDLDGLNTPNRWSTLVLNSSDGSSVLSLPDFAAVGALQDPESSLTTLLVMDTANLGSSNPDFGQIVPITYTNGSWRIGDVLAEDARMAIVPPPVVRYDSPFVFGNWNLMPTTAIMNTSTGILQAFEYVDGELTKVWEKRFPSSMSIIGVSMSYPAGDTATEQEVYMYVTQSNHSLSIISMDSAETIYDGWVSVASNYQNGSLLVEAATEDTCSNKPLIIGTPMGGALELYTFDSTTARASQLHGIEGLFAGLVEVSNSNGERCIQYVYDNGVSLVALQDDSLEGDVPFHIDVPESCADVNGLQAVDGGFILMCTNEEGNSVAYFFEAQGMDAAVYNLEEPTTPKWESVFEEGTYVARGKIMVIDEVDGTIVVPGEDRVLYLNMEDGTVANSVPTPTDLTLKQIGFADIDSDDTNELIMLSCKHPNCDLSAIDEENGWSVGLSYSVDVGMALADFDGDGIEDVLVFGGTGIDVFNGIHGSLLWQLDETHGIVYGVDVLLADSADSEGESDYPHVRFYEYGNGISKIRVLNNVGTELSSDEVGVCSQDVALMKLDSPNRLLLAQICSGIDINLYAKGLPNIHLDAMEVDPSMQDSAEDIDTITDSSTIACASNFDQNIDTYVFEVRTESGCVIAKQSITVSGEDLPFYVGPVVFEGLNLALGTKYFCAVRGINEESSEITPWSVGDGVELVDAISPFVVSFVADPARFNPQRGMSVLSLMVQDNVGINSISIYPAQHQPVFVLGNGLQAMEYSYTFDGKDENDELLPDGEYTIKAVVEDVSGFSGAGIVVVSVDTTAPAAPQITEPNNGMLIFDARPLFAGSAPTDVDVASISIFEEDSMLCEALPLDDGSFYCRADSAMEDGTHTVFAVAVDTAGNESEQSESVSFTIRSSGVSAPEILVPEDGETLPDGTFDVLGRGEPLFDLKVFVDSEQMCDLSVEQSGNWTCSIEDLEPGVHVVQARLSNEELGIDLWSEAVEFTVAGSVVDGDEESFEQEPELEEDVQENAPSECSAPECPTCKDSGGGCAAGSAAGAVYAMLVLLALRRRRR